MRSKLYTHTRPHIISMRVSDEEMKEMKMLMEKTNLKASEVIRRGFGLIVKRLSDQPTGNDGSECAAATHG